MTYQQELELHKDWWERHFPGQSELSVATVAKCLKVKADKLKTDPEFPSFRDGRNFKVTVARLARWQTDRASGKLGKDHNTQ